MIITSFNVNLGNGWQWGVEKGLGELSLCINQQPWSNFCGEPPCGMYFYYCQLVPQFERFIFIIIRAIKPKKQQYLYYSTEIISRAIRTNWTN